MNFKKDLSTKWSSENMEAKKGHFRRIQNWVSYVNCMHLHETCMYSTEIGRLKDGSLPSELPECIPRIASLMNCIIIYTLPRVLFVVTIKYGRMNNAEEK